MLREYRRKRDFSKTKEPSGGVKATKREQREQRGQGKGDDGLFVIQKHAARRLHYDFRLAMGGVLKSWAVPRGIPLVKGEKRLAVEVEDHPLDYARFEGIIPAGEYGAGTVMVWDIGRYEVGGGSPLYAWEVGKLHLFLEGEKLRGEWTLVRTRLGGEGSPQWLLMKTGDSVRAGVLAAHGTHERSALSGRTMDEIARERGEIWHSNREAARSGRKRPAFIPPMNPKLVKTLPTTDGEAWSCELKLDGYRALAVKEGQEVRLFSRNEKRLDFPALAAAIARLPCRDAVLDGEIVALDQAGHPSFQRLQRRGRGETPVIRYYLFDLLELDGEKLLKTPLAARKARLSTLLEKTEEPLRFSADLPGTPARVLEEVKKRGLEGIIAKRKDSPYEPGKRSAAWVKIKCINEQEFVIGGYTAPKGARSGFGALLVGYFEGGKLKFAGKVGTGFDEKQLQTLFAEFQKERIESSPFADLPPGAGRGVSAAELRRCTWLQPRRVCQIKFSEWTRDGRLRQPVFMGLREDKEPSEVVREVGA